VSVGTKDMIVRVSYRCNIEARSRDHCCHAKTVLHTLCVLVYVVVVIQYTGRFIMFSVISNIYSKITKGHTLMEFFRAIRKLKKFFGFPVAVNNSIKFGSLVFLL
jgi:hypothetical protein